MSESEQDILDLERFFPYRLSVLYRGVSDAIAQHYHDEFDLTRMEWQVMATLAMQGRASARQICDFTQMAKMQASRAISRMRQRGLLREQVSAGDQRVVELSLTGAGRDVYRRIVPRVRRREREILACLNAREREQLQRILDKFDAALSRR